MGQQVRQLRLSREHGMRLLHVELLKLSLSDPLYMDCWGTFSDDPEPASRRQHLFTNLIISHWQLAFEIGYLEVTELRLMAEDLFTAEPAQKFWLSGSETRRAVLSSHRDKWFHEILEESFRTSIANQRASAVNPEANTGRKRGRTAARRLFQRSVARCLERAAGRFMARAEQ